MKKELFEIKSNFRKFFLIKIYLKSLKIEEPKEEEEIKPETEIVDKKVTTEPPKYVLQKLPTSADKRQPIATPAPSKLIDYFYYFQ